MNRKKSIALLVSYVESPFFGKMIKGARMAAEEHNVNLLVIPGYNMLSTEINDGSRPEYEYQSNTLFSFTDPESVDVVIASPGNICLDGIRTAEFVKMISKVPVLTVSDRINGVPYIQYDNSNGIINAMNYLIRDKGCTNIGMVSGPKGNADAMQRLQAYRECLRVNGISFDEKKIVYGGFMPNCADIVRDLFERNPKLEAVVCANDLMAHSVYQVVEENDRAVGRDIFVVGFDDDIGSADMKPPLASVRADAVNLGYEAVLLASRMADGERPSPKILKTEFVNRESAGFYPYNTISDLEKRSGVNINTVFNIDGICETLLDFVFTGVPHDYQAECQKKLIQNVLMRILTRYFGNVLKRNSFDDIYAEFSNIIERGAMAFIDSNRLFRVFDTIYHIYCEKEMTLSGRVELNDLLSNLKIKVVEYLSRKAEDSHKVMDSMLRSMNWLAGNLMTLSGDPEAQYEKLLDGMNPIGVMNAYIFTWERPLRVGRRDKWEKPEYMLLKAFRNQKGTTHIPRSMQRIRSSNILDNRFMDSGRTTQWLLMGLYQMDIQIGVIMIDLDEDYFDCFEFISNQINITVKNITAMQALKYEKLRLDLVNERQLIKNSPLIEEYLKGIPDLDTFCGEAEKLIMDQADTGRIIILECIDAGSIVDHTDRQDTAGTADIIGKCRDILKKSSADDAIAGYIWHGRFAALFTSDDIECRKKTEAVLLREADALPDQIHVSVSEFRYHEDIRIREMLEEVMDVIEFEEGRKESSLL